MTPTGHSEIHPGRKIAARRAELNKSLMDIENETNGVIYSKLLYRVENAKKPLETLNVKQLNALLKALEWTPREFAEATGVEVPGADLGTGNISAPTKDSYEHMAAPENERIRRLQLLGADIDYGIMESFFGEITPEERDQIEQALEVVEDAEKYLSEEVKDSINVLERVAREVLKLLRKSTATEGVG